MTESMPLLRFIVVLGLAAALLEWSSEPVLTITNRSGVVLSNVVVSGSGFSEHVGTIGTGGDRRVTVHPRGESGVRVVFDAGSQHMDSGEQGYFEASGGYRVAITVDADLKVSVSSDLKPYEHGEVPNKPVQPTRDEAARG